MYRRLSGMAWFAGFGQIGIASDAVTDVGKLGGSAVLGEVAEAFVDVCLEEFGELVDESGDQRVVHDLRHSAQYSSIVI